MNEELQKLFAEQGQAIATLALRVTTLEQILLEKKLITEDEVAKKAVKLSRDFTVQVQEALRKAAERETKGE